MKKIYDMLVGISGNDNVFTNEPLSKHTTFKIGGAADILVTPHTIDEIKQIISACKNENIKYYVIGNGSNLLVSDEGYRGVIIKLYSNFSDIIVDGTKITALSGALLGKIGHVALKHSLAGFEFATGIPGTLGGAVVMNAGAYGGELKDVLEKVLVLTTEGDVITLTNEQLKLGYRTSIIPENNYIVLSAELRLTEGNEVEIKKLIDELAFKRRDKQPLEYPSAGSTFKRPKDNFAGKLIMEAGLKGYQCGGARVSDKHCGFVINTGDATCKDVTDLAEHVKKEVKAQFGVELELEVKRLD